LNFGNQIVLSASISTQQLLRIDSAPDRFAANHFIDAQKKRGAAIYLAFDDGIKLECLDRIGWHRGSFVPASACPELAGRFNDQQSQSQPD